jgi:hypothetical protein
MDYAPAGVQYSVAPVRVFTLDPDITPPPAGLVIDPVTGKLSGVITAACGTYSFSVTATPVAGPISVLLVTMFISSLPNALDLMKRLPYDQLKACTVDYLNSVADSSLRFISEWTGCPIEPGTCGVPQFTDEVLATKSFTKRIMPRHHPVQSIISATNNTTALTVGSMKDVQLGNANIAIMPDGDSLWLDSIPWRDGYGSYFLTYTAGFAVLPSDLFEVFVYLSGLLFRERDRIGLETLGVGESNTKYFRDLPWPQQTAINNRRRVGLYV